MNSKKTNFILFPIKNKNGTDREKPGRKPKKALKRLARESTKNQRLQLNEDIEDISEEEGKVESEERMIVASDGLIGQPGLIRVNLFLKYTDHSPKFFL